MTFSVVEIRNGRNQIYWNSKAISYLYVVVDCIVMYIMCVFIIAILSNVLSSQL